MTRRRKREKTPEERALDRARKRANAKLSFYTHLVVFCSVNAMLVVVSPLRAAIATAMSWGIGLAVHYFVVMVAPELREKLVRNEIGRQVAEGGTQERRVTEARHARHVEELSASIAHEIRNPISAAKSLVQQMGEDPRSAENIDYANVALDELDRVERSISHLLRFAREEEVRFEPLRLADVVSSAVDTFRDRLSRRGVALTQELDGQGVLRGDPEKLRRVVINLVGNALDAFDESGTREPRIEIQAGENLAGDHVWLRVRDNGPGIDPALQAKIFSPFYTSKDSGTGLGLALSKKVVDAHGGTIEIESAPGAGTAFIVSFPKPDGIKEGAR
ncbi:MAG: ATP-binding protein [Proteobacteria bacterium]|nr:ATP-binding protein [Pseudomonadota bacterium]